MRNSSSTYVLQSLLIIAFGLCPLIICALLSANHGNWELFERSGSITTAIGLLLASRRYIRRDVSELVALGVTDQQEYSFGESVTDAITGKLGLALSAFGTLVWGWGTYLGWWSFTYLVLWAALDLPRARRDYIQIRSSDLGLPDQH